ncbi:MAG TPA: hypothetical protein VEJ41_04205 [Candidatus Acidoferrales bacterium]|nr:hypothetical protein [Candidatus Acidoferrales bacterium]
MMVRAIAIFSAGVLGLGQVVLALAQPTAAPGSGPLPVGASITLAFRTSVQAQGSSTTATGTVKIARSSANAVSITLSPDGGTPETLDLTQASDGSYQPTAETIAQMSVNEQDPQTAAAAKAMLGRLLLTTKIASNVLKLKGSAPFSVPYNLVPIGESTPIPTTLNMVPGQADEGAVVYQGETQGQSMTILPPSNGKAAKSQKMKTTGLALLVSLALSPVAGIALHIGSRIQQKNIQKALKGPLPVSSQLTVIGHFAPGPQAQVSGTQFDTVNVKGHNETITTTWSFATTE